MSRSKSSYHHGNLKTDTLKLAIKVIEKLGAQGVKMRELAEKLGVSHGALFKHFSSREDLLFTIAEEGFREMLSKLKSAEISNKDLATSLESLGRCYIEFTLEHPGYFEVMFQIREEDRAKSKSLHTLSQACYSVLKGAVKQHIKREDKSELISITAWSFIHGLSTLEAKNQIKEVGVPIDQHKKLLKQIITDFCGSYVQT